jgi:hypothetical protein
LAVNDDVRVVDEAVTLDAHAQWVPWIGGCQPVHPWPHPKPRFGHGSIRLTRLDHAQNHQPRLAEVVRGKSDLQLGKG